MRRVCALPAGPGWGMYHCRGCARDCGRVPAEPGRKMFPLPGAWPLSGRHSCRAGVRSRQAAGCCGRAFLRRRAGTCRPAWPLMLGPPALQAGVCGEPPAGPWARARMHPCPWSLWSEWRSGWYCSPCCHPWTAWRCGWSGTPRFLPRRASGRWAAWARWMLAPFLQRLAGCCRTGGMPLFPAWVFRLCRRAAHSCGAARPQAVRSFSGPAGAVRRRAGNSTRRGWDCRYGQRSGTGFPAGYPFAGRRCGRCTCRRHVHRQRSRRAVRRFAFHSRRSGRRWGGPRPVRRQRNRLAVRRFAFHSWKSDRCWSGRRPGRRQTVPRRQRKRGGRAGSRQTHRCRNACRKRRPRSRSQGCPSRSWWPGLSPCAPPCSPPCPAGSVPRRR